MNERLKIDFAPAEGSIIRIVGLIERRGYDVLGITMSGDEASASLVMDLRPRDAGRRLPVVAQHVSKLVDVRKVSFDDFPAEATV